MLQMKSPHFSTSFLARSSPTLRMPIGRQRIVVFAKAGSGPSSSSSGNDPVDPSEKFLNPADILRQIAGESGMRFVTVRREDEDEEDRETYLEALEDDPWMRDDPSPAPENDGRFLTGLNLDPNRPSKSAYEDADVALISVSDLAALLEPKGDAGASRGEGGAAAAGAAAGAGPSGPEPIRWIVVDIREESDYAKRHIPGSRNIPLSLLTRQNYGEEFGAPDMAPAGGVAGVAGAAPQAAPGIVVVGEGSAAGLGVDQMAKQAYVRLNRVFKLDGARVRLLEGGVARWEAEGRGLGSA